MCIPMIPMTVAFFRRSWKQEEAVFKALIFGLSIVLIYLSLGVIVSWQAPELDLQCPEHPLIPNVIFFILFVAFAASFFGAFELFAQQLGFRADSRVDKGGILASFFWTHNGNCLFFMYRTHNSVLLVQAATGEILRPTIGMLGFGFAFALPFTIFALFPSVMSRLPKSGGWLNSIKLFLDLLCCISMKFLSTIDSVYSLRIISRDIFLAIWIVIFSLMDSYLLGKIKFCMTMTSPLSEHSVIPYYAVFSL